MSNALEAASLIMVPSGYENGTLASVKPNDGTGDFTFSRGSNLSATRINEQGYIEKGYENLLLQSNSFDTNWAQVNLLPPTSGQAGYDGTNDAWYFEKVGAFGRLQQSISTSGVRTLSVYLKAKDSSWVSVEAAGTNTSRQYFDLTNISKGSSNNIISSYIVDAGDGWRKCSITYEGTKTLVFIFIAEGNGQVNGTTGSLYIQDAQINQGLVAYPYIETTTTPVSGGILEDMPRLDWASGAPSLLLEPSRTNLVPHSEYFGAWDAIGSTQTLINNTNPVDNVAYEIKSSVTASSSRIYQNGLMTSGNDYSSSYLVKPSSNSPEYLGFACASNLTPDVLYNFATDSFEDFNTIGNAAKCESISMNNGWKLLKVPVHENVNNTRFNIYQGSKVGNALQGTTGQSYYLKFAQLEDATYPTSYIPTYGVSQTRLRDAQAELTIPNGNVSDGTIFYEFDKAQAPVSYQIVPLMIGSNRMLRISQYNPNMRFAINENATSYDEPNTYNSNVKVAVSYSGSVVKLFINGNLRATDNTYSGSGNVIVPINGLQATQLNCSLESKQLLYFPTALSDEECIQLTTV